MKLAKYPYIKVITGFTLAPALASFIWGVLSGFSVLTGGVDKLSTAVALIFVIGISGFVLFCIPAFAISVIYAVLRLHKSWTSYLLVLFVGGCIAHLWLPIIWRGGYAQWELTDIFHVYFALGAVSSVLMAYFVLPKKPIKQPEEPNE